MNIGVGGLDRIRKWSVTITFEGLQKALREHTETCDGCCRLVKTLSETTHDLVKTFMEAKSKPVMRP